jgi:septation ring formation regulator EzrA
MRQTIKTAMLLADALNIGSAAAQKTVSMFLQQAPEVQMEDYKFHSDGIIDTLEKLLDQFRDEKTSVDAAEVKAVQEHTLFIQIKTDLIKKLNHELAEAKKERASTIADIETNSEELTTVAATLLDDQEYLKELASMCHEKALTWDQRSKLRQNELAMLTEVIGIITSSVTEKTSAATIRFAQEHTSMRLARAVAHSERAMEAVEAEAEEAEGTPIGFLQSAQRSLPVRQPKTGQKVLSWHCCASKAAS